MVKPGEAGVHMGKPYIFSAPFGPNYHAEEDKCCARFMDKNFIIPDDVFDPNIYLVGEMHPKLEGIECFQILDE